MLSKRHISSEHFLFTNSEIYVTNKSDFREFDFFLSINNRFLGLSIKSPFLKLTYNKPLSAQSNENNIPAMSRLKKKT
jgi:hypothetical protein